MFEDFGERLKKLRTAKGLTQAELGGRINRSAALIGKYETGEMQPALEVAFDLALQLGVSPDELLGCENCSRIPTSGLTDAQKEIITRLVGFFRS